MELDLNMLRPQERLSLRLRLLYEEAGFRQYRMGRFEEYGLYQQNRRFLASDQVITFTDLDGRLLALKPDVTLSIVKNAPDAPGTLQKVYYHESVYRTSSAAMGYMTCWLNHFAQIKKFPLRCAHYSGEQVRLTPESPVFSALEQGGVVVLHLFLDVGHYVLLTGLEKDRVLFFDPFYEEADDPQLDKEYDTHEISFIWDQPKRANRSVSLERINRLTKEYYEMGDYAFREALVMFNTADDSES